MAIGFGEIKKEQNVDALDGLKKSIDELGAAVTKLVEDADKARDEIKRLQRIIELQKDVINELRSQVVEVN